MKNCLTLLFFFTIVNLFGQQSGPAKGVNLKLNTEIDTTLKVIYVDKDRKSDVAFFSNNKFLGSSTGPNVKMTDVESVDVEKRDTVIMNKKYYGLIFMSTKIDYNPQLITLNELKHKYVKHSDKPAIFMVDNELINDDPDKYVIDEKGILRVYVNTITRTKDNLDMLVINLSTKSEKNINKLKEIMIR